MSDFPSRGAEAIGRVRRPWRTAVMALAATLALSVAAAEKHLPVLRAGTQTYSNVVVTGQSGANLFINHDGGMAAVKVADMDEETRAQLGISASQVQEEPEPVAATNQRSFFSGGFWWAAGGGLLFGIVGLVLWLRKPADPTTGDYQPETEIGARVFGAVLLGIGAALAKWQIYDPLHAIELHRKMLFLSFKLLVVAVLLGFTGIFYLVLGKRANRLLAGGGKTLLGKIALYSLGAVVVLAIFFLDHYIRQQVSAQGYGGY